MTRAAYGSGSVRERPDGTWQAQWNAGKHDDGTRNRRTVTGRTEAEARRKMMEARGKSSSTKRRRGGESVAAFLDRWLEEVVAKRRRERTLVGYRSIVDRELVPAFGDTPLVSLTRRSVQVWVNGQRAAPLTIRHRVDCLRSAMGWAVRWGLIETNPARDLDLPAIPRRIVRAVSHADARAVLEAVDGTWFAPLVVLAVYTGLRQGELLGLRWQDVDLKARSLTVHHSLARLPGRHGTRFVLDAPKSDHSRRTIPLAPPAFEALDAQRRAQLAGPGSWKGLVFAQPDRPVDGTRLTHDFQAALAKSGLPPMRWHDLRHAAASLLIADGVPLPVVSAILGHSGIGITVDVYGHLTEDTKRAALDHMAAKMAGTA